MRFSSSVPDRGQQAALGCLPDSAAVLDRVGIPALGLGYTAAAGVPVAGAARSCVFAACCGGLSRRGVRMPGFGCEGYARVQLSVGWV